jgi:hypothetical protein
MHVASSHKISATVILTVWQTLERLKLVHTKWAVRALHRGLFVSRPNLKDGPRTV